MLDLFKALLVWLSGLSLDLPLTPSSFMVLSKTNITRDPYLRSSMFVLWYEIQDVRLSGQPADITIGFSPEQGYYIGDSDLISFTSLDLNPTTPQMPNPRYLRQPARVGHAGPPVAAAGGLLGNLIQRMGWKLS
jgi:hypothetical protein